MCLDLIDFIDISKTSKEEKETEQQWSKVEWTKKKQKIS